MDEHPSAEQLTAFMQGRLPQEEAAVIEGHVAGCPACCRVLEAVPPDSFLELVRDSVRQDGTMQPTVPESDLGLSSTPPQADGGQAGAGTVPAALRSHPRYRVVRLLGRGGMGVVYLAEHLVMQRLVALKVLAAPLLDRPEAVARFHQEVKAAARLAHPQIVTAYDAEQAGDSHFLVMEYVDGLTLGQLVERRGPMLVPQACDAVRQAAWGLEHACEHGLVHRDLKPQNLMMTGSGQVKILDFGLARFASEELGPAQSGERLLLGTADYLAPEQAADPRRADTRSDLYSLGCTLYFLLTGQPPFPDGGDIGKALAHRERRPRPVSDFRADVPAGLIGILDRLLAKEPAERFQSPQELIAALEPYLNDQSSLPVDRTSVTKPAPAPAEGHAGGRQLNSLLRQRWPWAVALLAAGPACLVAWLTGHVANRTSGLPPPSSLGAAGSTEVRGPTGVVPAVNQVRCFVGHTDAVFRIAVNADGTRLLSGGADQTVRLWDLNSGELLQCFRGHAATVWAVRFSPDGRHAWSGGSDGARHWELATGQEVRHVVSPVVRTSAVAFDGGGRQALFGGHEGDLCLWDLELNRQVHRLVGHQDRINALIFLADGKHAVSASGGPRNSQDATARLWDLSQGKAIARCSGHQGDVHQAAVAPDGKTLLSVSDDGTVRLWNVATERELGRWPDPSDRGYCVAFAPGGRRALTGGRNGTVHLWEVDAGQIVQSFQGHTGPVRSVAFTPDGRFALSGNGDRTIRMWQLPES